MLKTSPNGGRSALRRENRSHSSGFSANSYLLVTMLRIHLLQHWYALSDLAMEEALIEVPTMRRFAGIDLISDRIPDETTILTLRHLLEKHGLDEQIFDTVKAHLSARGMTMQQDTIVDATLIAAPQLHQEQRKKTGYGDAPGQEGQPVVFRHVAGGPRSGRSTQVWTRTQA